MIAKPDILEVHICILAMPTMIEGGGDACRFKEALYGFKSEGSDTTNWVKSWKV